MDNLDKTSLEKNISRVDTRKGFLAVGALALVIAGGVLSKLKEKNVEKNEEPQPTELMKGFPNSDGIILSASDFVKKRMEFRDDFRFMMDREPTEEEISDMMEAFKKKEEGKTLKMFHEWTVDETGEAVKYDENGVLQGPVKMDLNTKPRSMGSVDDLVD